MMWQNPYRRRFSSFPVQHHPHVHGFKTSWRSSLEAYLVPDFFDYHWNFLFCPIYCVKLATLKSNTLSDLFYYRVRTNTAGHMEIDKKVIEEKKRDWGAKVVRKAEREVESLWRDSMAAIWRLSQPYR